MIKATSYFVRGVVSSIILLGNTILWFIPILFLGLLKLLLPVRPIRAALSNGLVWCAENWVRVNGLLLDTLLSIRWDIEGVNDLRREEWYLVASNHQTWVDIPVLQYVFSGRIPFLKFFIKQQLIWVPMMGFAWWALDMPFMRRYSRAQLEARPELKGRDLDTTRKACEKFRQQPTSVINFLEGTRFTPEKHAARGSEFDHLLPPRAGGIAFAISVLGEKFHSLLDVTIFYPGVKPSFWALLSGRVKRIVVHVHKLEIPPEMLEGNYMDDPEHRESFQQWINEIWQEKDKRLSDLHP
ncbi:MAG: acyltransferase [Gammaproteobacteria bacterium]|nr:acyltransferase [Gammaproteobacteria bacterium]